MKPESSSLCYGRVLRCLDGAGEGKDEAGQRPRCSHRVARFQRAPAISVSEDDFKRLPVVCPGALLPVLKTKEKHGAALAQVGALNLNTGSMELGWVEITPSELKPPRNPIRRIANCCALLGGPYLEDFTSEHTDIARFLVRQARARRRCSAMW